MVKPEPVSSTATAFLRFYGFVSVLYGVLSLWLDFHIEPGAHGIADPAGRWPLDVAFIILGTAVLLLLRWFALVFAIASTILGLIFIGQTVTTVPFPVELINIAVGGILILPALLTYQAWRSLR